MSISDKILAKLRPKHVFLIFIIVHITLFDVNASEWGDSYRILRAAEFVRNFSYPLDEKRPPLFSILLSIRPENVDQVFWGRVVLLAFSLGSFYIFYKLCSYVFKRDLEKRSVALLIFLFNPVYLYWSLRIMADVPFSFLVLLSFYIVIRFKRTGYKMWPLLLGYLVGLAVLMRFEGYILFVSGLFSIVLKGEVESFSDFFPHRLIQKIKNSLRDLFSYVMVFGLTILPYILYRNPFGSSYFDEPSGRIYDINTLLTFVLSLAFMFGSLIVPALLHKSKNIFKYLFFKEAGLTVYILMSLLLVLVWPAAVPRLFVPIIPFLIIGVVAQLYELKKFSVVHMGLASVSIGLYVIGQYYYKLQFLIVVKPAFVLVLILGLLQLFFASKKKFSELVILFLLSTVVWSLSVIWSHKDIYLTVQEVSQFAEQNASGKIGYNDITSVSDWYFNYESEPDSVEGIFYDITQEERQGIVSIESNQLDYILFTNAHDPGTDVDLTGIDYLKLKYRVEREINGAIFETELYEVL